MFLKSLSIAKVILALKYVENINIKLEIIIDNIKKVKSIEKLLTFSISGNVSLIIKKKLLLIGWLKKAEVNGIIELMPISWKIRPSNKARTKILR